MVSTSCETHIKISLITTKAHLGYCRSLGVCARKSFAFALLLSEPLITLSTYYRKADKIHDQVSSS